MNRRNFISLVGALALAPALNNAFPTKAFADGGDFQDDGSATELYIFNQMLKEIDSNKYQDLPIGELMTKIGSLFIGTKYEAGMLDVNDKEKCIVHINTFDCVTFFETTLCMARIIKKGNPTFEALVKEVQFTRYRGGVLTDYSSRLHYTADWIMDNIKKKVIQDGTQELGGEEFKLNVGFMSKHPEFYRALKSSPEMVSKIAKIENSINENSLYMIPKNKIKKMEKRLLPGNIIAIATDKEGLDYAHVGLIGEDKHGANKFLHASLNKEKVILDATISKYIAKNSSQIGISVLSPLEP